MDKKKINYTHNQLIVIAKNHLWKKGCTVVITEMCSGLNAYDAIGWKNCVSTIIECKAFRDDFKGDVKKLYRQFPEASSGTYRYYLTPKGMIDSDELPYRWGLIEVREDGSTRVKQKSDVFVSNKENDVVILISAIRRIGTNVDEVNGVSVRFYTAETKNTATLGVRTENEVSD